MAAARGRVGTAAGGAPLAPPRSWVVDYSSGAIAGMACVAVGHPWDSVKTRLQAGGGARRRGGAWACLKETLAKGGARGLYAGLTPRMLGGAAEAAVLMGVYSAVHAALTAEAPPGGGGGGGGGGGALGLGGLPPGAAAPLAGAAAGAAVSLVLGPSELIKCRMQLVGTDPAHSYRGPMDCLRRLLATEGARGLTRGLGATMAREVPGNAVYFSVYQALRQLLPGKPPAGDAGGGAAPTRREELADAFSAIVCGGLAGMALWAAVMPLDAAKTRIQAATGRRGAGAGVAQALRALYREGGMARLYAGTSPAVARAFPANAAQWLVFELSCKQLARWQDAAAAPAARERRPPAPRRGLAASEAQAAAAG
ncbi:MAG: mitochondrial carrier domain-containing protein [Monoraphidium minutum]|nr:MAG: mitochondrial carrier domain-containing protein [Monoraphidium minutum]